MTSKLIEYNEKRNFDKTLEPEGVTEASGGGLRFVVQHHLARREHYDLRLEWDGVLLSWAVPKGPSYHPHDKRLAVMVEDHPLAYRNFEGTIPKGEYGGGVVMLWDEGFWEPYGDVEDGLAKGELKFMLKGRRLKGKWVLIQWKAKSNGEQDYWLLIKENDEYVQQTDGISDFNTSIRTHRTMAEIEQGVEDQMKKNPFDKVTVQLAALVHTIPEGEDWLYELKYDGYRIIAFVESNIVRLITRNGHDYTTRFHTIASSLSDFAAGRAMVLDGEMTITDDEGKTDFQALQSYMKNPRDKSLTYIVFDLLALDGEDLRGLSLIDRKERLETLLAHAPNNLHYSRHIRGKGQESFAVACESGMEGIIGKKADSIYSGARNGSWIKLKCDKRQAFVIGGYTLTDKKKSGVSSLLLGIYDDEELIYVGRAGTGMSMADMAMLEEKFNPIKQQESPFKHPPSARANEKLTWLKPEYVADIKFAEWTNEGLLRQASFKGLLSDQDPTEVKITGDKDNIRDSSYADEGESSVDRIEQISDHSHLVKGEGSTKREISTTELKNSTNSEESPLRAISHRLTIAGINITNPDRIVFDDPKITKEDVIRYYEQISKLMLPYVRGRILSTVRCPRGISHNCFYKKHPSPNSAGIITIPVTNRSGDTEDYFYIDDVSGLIFEAQMGTLEFHIWGSRVDQLEKPDMMVFDLDPDEGMELSVVRQGVRDMKNILDELSLNSFLKTSGGKGYHVVVPFQRAMTWDEFNDFAKRVAEVMVLKWPDRYTSNVRKAKRQGKIFIDWIRNGRGATSIAPYSLRARKGACVSMPIAWNELDEVAPDGINMADALSQLGSSDPWEGIIQ